MQEGNIEMQKLPIYKTLNAMQYFNSLHFHLYLEKPAGLDWHYMLLSNFVG